MIVTTRITGIEGLAQRLDAALAPRLASDAVDAAASALAAEAARAGVSVDRAGQGATRRVGSADPEAVARETGTLTLPPAPWLAPALAALRRRA
ncbi:hypothetical protein ABLE91_23670 [Aquabacter sp. CN5-332]|uniref:hypothetical protein n=1 Tax=Aquabacter sp. CN5-332 TaxID=3156608 RepID=UPI0032B6261B